MDAGLFVIIYSLTTLYLSCLSGSIVEAQSICYNDTNVCNPHYPCPQGAVLPYPLLCTALQVCVAPYEYAVVNECLPKYVDPSTCRCGGEACLPPPDDCNPPSELPIPPEPCFKSKPPVLCRPGARVPDRYYCTRFFQCNFNNEWISTECQENNYFNNNYGICTMDINVCDNIDFANCYTTMTTTPESTTEQTTIVTTFTTLVTSTEVSSTTTKQTTYDLTTEETLPMTTETSTNESPTGTPTDGQTYESTYMMTSQESTVIMSTQEQIISTHEPTSLITTEDLGTFTTEITDSLLTDTTESIYTSEASTFLPDLTTQELTANPLTDMTSIKISGSPVTAGTTGTPPESTSSDVPTSSDVTKSSTQMPELTNSSVESETSTPVSFATDEVFTRRSTEVQPTADQQTGSSIPVQTVTIPSETGVQTSRITVSSTLPPNTSTPTYSSQPTATTETGPGACDVLSTDCSVGDKVPHHDCQLYYECQVGSWTLHSCVDQDDDKTYYNPKRLKCDRGLFIDCDTPCKEYMDRKTRRILLAVIPSVVGVIIIIIIIACCCRKEKEGDDDVFYEETKDSRNGKIIRQQSIRSQDHVAVDTKEIIPNGGGTPPKMTGFLYSNGERGEDTSSMAGHLPRQSSIDSFGQPLPSGILGRWGSYDAEEARHAQELQRQGSMKQSGFGGRYGEYDLSQAVHSPFMDTRLSTEPFFQEMRVTVTKSPSLDSTTDDKQPFAHF